MAFLGSNVTSEVGLPLLLCPLGSNIVTRAACCSVGIVLPVYSTFRAIERNDENEQQKWLTYWAAYGSFTIVEVFSDKLLSWFPYFYHFKFAFLVWLQLPSTEGAKQIHKNHLRPFLLRHQAKVDQLMGFVCSEMGAKQIHKNHLRPFLLRHQAKVDQLMGFVCSEMARFVSTHQEEFRFVRIMFRKMTGSNAKVRGAAEPNKPRGLPEIDGQTRMISDPESDHNE